MTKSLDRRVAPASTIGHMRTPASIPVAQYKSVNKVDIGSEAMTVAVVLRSANLAPVTGTNEFIVSMHAEPGQDNSGWVIEEQANGRGLGFYCFDDAGAVRHSIKHEIRRTEVESLHVFLVSVSYAEINAWWDGVFIGSTPTDGQVAYGANAKFAINGSWDGAATALPYYSGEVLAVLVSSDYTLPVPNVPAFCADLIAAVEEGRELPFWRTPVVNSDYCFDARGPVQLGGGALALTWTDTISGHVLQRTGRPQGRSSTARFGVDTSYSSELSLVLDGAAECMGEIGGTWWNWEYTQAATYQFWIKTTMAVGTGFIMGKKQTRGGADPGWLVYNTAAGQIRFVLKGVGGDALDARSVAVINDGLWHHVFITHDGSGTGAGCNIFIDGVASLFVEATPVASSILNAVNATVGTSGAGANFFAGSLDDIAIHTVYTGSNTARECYNAGKPIDLRVVGPVPFLDTWLWMEAEWTTRVWNRVAPFGHMTTAQIDLTNYACDAPGKWR